jgi:hypothetical protein
MNERPESCPNCNAGHDKGPNAHLRAEDSYLFECGTWLIYGFKVGDWLTEAQLRLSLECRVRKLEQQLNLRIA